MEDNDKQRFLGIMMGVAQNFSSELDDHGLNMMFDSLSEYTIDQVYSASISIMRTRVYTTMPTVAEYVTAISGPLIYKADKQLQSIRNAISGCGRNGNPKFKDPTTHYLVHERFGWQRICNTREADMKFFEREFAEAYAVYSTSPELLQVEGPQEPKVQIPNVVKKIN